jgi:hypothetical protein
MAIALVSCGAMAFLLFDYGKHADSPAAKKNETSRPTEAQHRGGELAPIQVYAKVQVGDWIAYRVTTRSSLLPNEVSGLVLGRVTAATDTQVTIDYKAVGEKNIDRTEAWSEQQPRQNLTLDQLTDNTNEWTMFDLLVTDDVHEIDGRAFTVRIELWYSDEVALGLVEDRDVQGMPKFHSEQTKRLIGFGTATATTWGTKPAGLQ